jgi:hypothetical protein
MHHWPAELPRWIALVAVVAVYALIALPLGAARRASLYYANGGRLHGWADAWSGLLWLAIVCTALWATWTFAPWTSEVLRNLLQGVTTMSI